MIFCAGKSQKATIHRSAVYRVIRQDVMQYILNNNAQSVVSVSKPAMIHELYRKAQQMQLFRVSLFGCIYICIFAAAIRKSLCCTWYPPLLAILKT